MSLLSLSIQSDATWSSVGGAALAFVSDGRQVKDGLSLVVASDQVLTLRRSIQFTSVLPSLATKAGGFPKMGRNRLDYKIPMLAADGRIYLNRVVVDVVSHPEFTRANRILMVKDTGALVLDADTAGFFSDSLLS